jgi:hypothetical protein
VPDLAVEDHSQEWRVALLTVIFARRHDARREEDGPAVLATAVTRGA